MYILVVESPTEELKDIGNSKPNISLKCRGCLAENNNMNPIFSNYKNNTTLAEIIAETVGCEMNEEEQGSYLLCEECTRIILAFRRFKRTFNNATEYFQSLTASEGESQNSEEENVSQDSAIKLEILDTGEEESICHYRTELDINECSSAESNHNDFSPEEFEDGHEGSNLELFNYVCQHCGKSFRTRGALFKHERIHTNPREVICDACGQQFNSRSTLNTHYKLKHIKSREFQCNLCGLAFTLKATLERHIKRHSSVRRRIYSCNLCGVSYKNKDNLNRHYRTSHNKIPSCRFCGISYYRKSDLMKHLNKYHKENQQEIIVKVVEEAELD